LFVTIRIQTITKLFGQRLQKALLNKKKFQRQLIDKFLEIIYIDYDRNLKTEFGNIYYII